MKRYVVVAVTLAILIFIIAPVVITQVTKPERRRFRFVKLSDTRHTEISFRNTVQDLDLGGMLFVPEGDGPFPAVAIIHGSGSSSRDNGWYLTLTKYLQENGITVLLPDKRGSEKSGGTWRTASYEDLANDTLAAIEYLKDQKKVAISKIGVIGMSQGGSIVPIVAGKSSDVAFVVNIVGSGVRAHEQLLYEEIYNLQEMGIPPQVAKTLAVSTTYSLIHVRKKEFWDAVGNFDPIVYWKKVTVSSLVLYGEKDTNVPSKKSAARFKALNNPKIKVKIFEGSAHALEDPVGQGDSIFRKDALQDIRDFILSAAGQPD